MRRYSQFEEDTGLDLSESTDPYMDEALDLLKKSGNIPNFGYWGDKELGDSWAFVYGVHRDSDLLEQSNFEVMEKRLKEISPEDVDIERASHWAVGWLDHLEVRMLTENGQVTEAGKAAIDMLKDIERYPVLDETHWSEKEFEYAQESIANDIDYAIGSYGNEKANVDAIYDWLYKNNMRAIEKAEEDPMNHSLDEEAIKEAMEALGMLDEDY